jgi:hypothetical protein
VAGFIVQQPNGLYCRFSTVVDCPTHWNMTREEYLNNVTGTVNGKEAGEEILNDYLKSFSEVLNCFVSRNMSQEEFDEIIKVMSRVGC